MKSSVWKSYKEWKKILTPEQYKVTREKATEPAFTGKYWDFYGDGIYQCVCCGQELFDSRHKYNSRMGWATFYQPTHNANIFTKTDGHWGEQQTEVLCSKCDAHLGHVLGGGPPPTELCYRIKSEALRFVERKEGSRH